MKILNINEKHEAKSYPYGRLRTSAFFWTEFKPKKGFRNGFQTINPKTGKLNAPKYGVYGHLCFHKQEDNGHFTPCRRNFYGFEEFNGIMKIVADNIETLALSPEMVNHIYQIGLLSLSANSRWHDDFDALKPLIDPVVTRLVHGINSGENVFSDLVLPLEQINNLKTTAHA